ncbi:hypothetical protein DSM26151_29270 [Agromyces marinus]|nr:hypothetical protein DSM26151_29270 [Agromyces marinus]
MICFRTRRCAAAVWYAMGSTPGRAVVPVHERILSFGPLERHDPVAAVDITRQRVGSLHHGRLWPLGHRNDAG